MTSASVIPRHDKALVVAFPEPPEQVREALEAMEIMRDGTPEEIDELGDTDALPVPWVPTSCPPELRQQLWLWCDDVAGWLNAHYVWRATTTWIPACWPRHTHIAQELPVLACLHYEASRSTSPALLEDWHRQTLPQFFDRLLNRLGESTCRTGAHVEWPALSRHTAFTAAHAVQERHDLFLADAHPPTRPRAERTGPHLVAGA